MSAFGPSLTRRDALALARRLIGTEPGEARFLVLDALGVSATELALEGDAAIGEAGATRIGDWVRRRLSGEPLARIVGEWEFWGLPFALSPQTLVPRPDTETLVEAALAGCPDRMGRWRILDLGTGSGCILTALLSECPSAYGVGLDLSYGALTTARANASRNGVAARAAFVNGSWCDALVGPFDLIVSNPPYIAHDVIAGLACEVRLHDPALALDGGTDGLDAYRGILGAVARRGGALLSPGGRLHLEIGYDQAEAVGDLARSTGFEVIAVTSDLAGHDRVVSLSLLPGTTAPPLGQTR